MNPVHPRIRHEFILAEPLRRDINLVAFFGKLPGQVRHHALRAALLQTVQMKSNLLPAHTHTHAQYASISLIRNSFPVTSSVSGLWQYGHSLPCGTVS